MNDVFMSDFFGINYEIFEEKGIFDAFLDHDSNFFINILRLKETTTPEFINSYNKINDYYRQIILLLDNADLDTKKDLCYKKALSLFRFSEVNGINLGFSESSSGNGFGQTLTEQVVNNAYYIVKKGCKEPELFHLLQLFEENIGPDRLSDMIATIILPDIKTYTLRIMEELEINPSKYPNEIFNKEGFIVNKFRNFPIYFLPIEILHELPVAKSWEDVEYAASQNDAIRREVNAVIGDEWNDWTTVERKAYIRENVFMNLDAFSRVIDEYRKSNLNIIDLAKDNKYHALKLWQNIKEQFEFSINFPSDNLITSLEGAKIAVENFKDWVENNKGWSVINREPEKVVQRLIHLASKKFLEENNLDLSCEPNEGPGPSDFKISRGNDKTIIELKLSSNNDYLNGYTDQIKRYGEAEKTDNMLYVYIDVGNPRRTGKLLQEYKLNLSHGYTMPIVYVIDANIQTSASIM